MICSDTSVLFYIWIYKNTFQQTYTCSAKRYSLHSLFYFLSSKHTVSTCVDRVIEMHFPEFSLYSGSEKLFPSSLTRLQKIDMMHSFMSLHRKRLHCILDVNQISLRLTLPFLYGPLLIP